MSEPKGMALKQPSAAHEAVGPSENAPFRVLTSKTVILSQSNIDTDQIIPARFLTTTTRDGLGKSAFYDWRYEADGSIKPEAVLNRIDPAEHRILLADTISAAARRANTPPGPWPTTAFAPSSRRRSPTSSPPTP